MKAKATPFSHFLLLLLPAFSCTEPAPPCTFPRLVTADEGCYEGGGLRLTPAEYGEVSGFVWNVYANLDTTRATGFNPRDLLIQVPQLPGAYTVPDSIVTKYHKVLIVVDANCEGSITEGGLVFGFIKTEEPGRKCVRWVPLQ